MTPSFDTAVAQRNAIAGGLHASSVGKAYPWAIVGRGDKWEVHNLQTGMVLHAKGLPYQSDLPHEAEHWAIKAAQGLLELGETFSQWTVRPVLSPFEHRQEALRAEIRGRMLDSAAAMRRTQAVVRGALGSRQLGQPHAGQLRAGDMPQAAFSASERPEFPIGGWVKAAAEGLTSGEGPQIEPIID
jgi:hypothetical protein